jgi:hypothetical protein
MLLACNCQMRWCATCACRFVGHPYVGVDFTRGICGVSIIRSGEAMETALRECCQGVKVGKILVHRCVCVLMMTCDMWYLTATQGALCVCHAFFEHGVMGIENACRSGVDGVNTAACLHLYAAVLCYRAYLYLGICAHDLCLLAYLIVCLHGCASHYELVCENLCLVITLPPPPTHTHTYLLPLPPPPPPPPPHLPTHPQARPP